jgi:hypothetical protein
MRNLSYYQIMGANKEFDGLSAEDEFWIFASQLSLQNASRYEAQARELIKKRTIKLELEGIPVRYRLNLTGCWFEIPGEVENEFHKKTWNRFGFGKAAKLKALPGFFAHTEAGLLFKSK